MRAPQNRLLSLSRGLAGVAALGLAISCSLSDDDDDTDAPATSAGSAGQSGVAFGGSAGTAGNESTAGTAGNGTPGPVCENIANSMCGGSSIEANFKTVNILLVIDKSGSMDDTPDGFENNKWSSLKEALDTALNRVAGDINFGLLLYPYSHVAPIPLDNCTRCCEVPFGEQAINVPIAEGGESIPQILRALDDSSPGGGTPTADALAGAIDYFTTGAGAALQGEKYVLLATDGGPNCNGDNTCDADRCTTNLDGACAEGSNCCAGGNLGERCLDDARVTEKIEALASAGIGTFVVGIPGTEAYASYLDEFARSGGLVDPDKPLTNPNAPPDYYAVSADGGVEGLVDVFDTITTQLVRACDIELASRPLDLEKVNVYIDCDVIPRGEDDEEPSWEVDTSTTPSLLHLRGQVCDRVANRGAERVDVIFGCPTIK